MDFGILRALKTLKNHPYVQYVGLGFAGLVQTGAPHDQEGGGQQRKTKLQLIRLSAAVCGIELCYAAETAFVSPILLKLGVPVSLMTMIWCLSPVLGFFLVPVMGSLSDRCPLALGRRRPFILVMSVGIVLGLVLVPNGEALGLWMGDKGTATLHHPKHFTPLNVTVAKSTTHKRLALSRHAYVKRAEDGDQKLLGKVLAKKSKFEKFNDLTANHSGRRKGHFLTQVSNKSNDDAGKLAKQWSMDENKEAVKSTRKSTPAKRLKRLPHPTEVNSSEGAQTSLSEDDQQTSVRNKTEEEAEESSAKAGPVFRLSEEHFRGIILTILGVALLDFNCDACQSPCRAYLLDVSIPEDHSSGLTMFTVMAGLGGTVGYVMGGIDWNATSFGEAFGGHIRVVFTLVIVFFIGCVASTMTSFKETPLNQLGYDEEQLQKKKKKVGKSKYRKFTNEDSDEETEERAIDNDPAPARYGAVRHSEESSKDRNNSFNHTATDAIQSADDTISFYHAHDPSLMKTLQLGGTRSTDMPEADRAMMPNGLHNYGSDHNLGLQIGGDASLDIKPPSPIEISADVTLKTYLSSIIHMPRCLWVLCVVNLFCWMSLVCYSLYFTDFVGQAVLMGDPQAPPGSEAHHAYDDGVRLGSFSMSLYSLSCSIYSLLIEKLVRRYRAKTVYVAGQLVFTLGMAVMAAARHKVAVVLLSPTAGIMYATLFTMPYLLVAHYHTSGLFSHGSQANPKQVRGLGTDVAIVSSMVFLAQFLLSVAMGTIIYAVSSTTAVIIASSVLSCLGALTATQVTYLDL